MADVHSKETRSYNMSMIKGKNTKPEIIVRQFLHANGYRYRINDKRYPGKPDLVLPKYKIAIFINGCFWHGHKDCKYFKLPNTRRKWWEEKIIETKKRDFIKKEEIMKIGFKVIVIWECELKPKSKENCLTKLVKKIENGNTCN
ncbi:MAG: very short patch repair endonuclease [Candidatus Thorarchaeota archaeon]